MTDVIDVESIQIDSRIDSNRFNLTADEVLYRTRCTNKSAFRAAVQKLIETHQIPVGCLRQGEARATRYCALAVDAIQALKSGDLAKLAELKLKICQQPTSSAIVLSGTEKHIELASSNSAMAEQNLHAIADRVETLFNRYERFGDALGDRLASVVEQRVSAKIADRLNKMTEV